MRSYMMVIYSVSTRAKSENKGTFSTFCKLGRLAKAVTLRVGLTYTTECVSELTRRGRTYMRNALHCVSSTEMPDVCI
jgi:hypothetical protein